MKYKIVGLFVGLFVGVTWLLTLPWQVTKLCNPKWVVVRTYDGTHKTWFYLFDDNTVGGSDTEYPIGKGVCFK